MRRHLLSHACAERQSVLGMVCPPLEDLQFEIKTGKANAADLTATIQKEIAIAEELTAKIEDLAADIAVDDAELKDATAIKGEGGGSIRSRGERIEGSHGHDLSSEFIGQSQTGEDK